MFLIGVSFGFDLGLPGVSTFSFLLWRYNAPGRGKRDSADLDFWATRGKREEGATSAEN